MTLTCDKVSENASHATEWRLRPVLYSEQGRPKLTHPFAFGFRIPVFVTNLIPSQQTLAVKGFVDLALEHP